MYLEKPKNGVRMRFVRVCNCSKRAAGSGSCLTKKAGFEVTHKGVLRPITERSIFMSRSLSQKIKNELYTKQRFGYSRHDEKLKYGGKSPYIHSYATFQTYLKECKQFGQWCKQNYGCKTVSDCAHHTKEYLEHCAARGNSAATLATKGAALAKLFDTSKDRLWVLTSLK